MSPEQRDRSLALLGVVARKFNPGQARVPGGEHGGEWTLTGAIKDALKLAGRIDLDDGEHLVASSRVEPHDGSDVLLALTSTPDGPRLRIGLIPQEDASRWRGADKGGTVVLDTAAAGSLRADLTDARVKAREWSKEYNRQSGLVDAAGGHDYPDSEAVSARGVVAGDWGDLVYEAAGTDDGEGGWQLTLGVRPSGSPPDWSLADADSARLEDAQLARLLRELDRLTAAST